MNRNSLIVCRRLLPLLGVMFVFNSASIASTEFSDQLRKDFRQSYALAQAGDRSAISSSAGAKFSNYPLWPDLQAAYYRTKIGKLNDNSILKFVEQHGDKSSAINLRYKWLTSMAKRGQWQTFIDQYEHHYVDKNNDVFECYNLAARMKLRPGKQTDEAALALWMSGASLPDECDPVFNSLKQRNLITTKLLRKRIDLALPAGNTKLAQYLAKSAHKKDVKRVDAWVRMRNNPTAQLKRSGKLRDNSANRDLLFYGFARAARRDPQTTYKLWEKFEPHYRFSKAQKNDMARKIALSAARDHLPIAQQWLSQLNEHSVDSASWYVRRSLTVQDWPSVFHAVSVMPEEERNDETWRYWQARALEAMGQSADAKTIYQEIATERSYYGFLAADRLQTPYQFKHQALKKEETLYQSLSQDPRVIRARELFLVNQYGLARSEWNRLINTLDHDQKKQAALLAGHWNWHSRAINTMARTSAADVMLSHPTPYKSVFYEATSRAGIDRTWAYGIARTESLFMPDVRSKANAYGLMQIIPSTGKLAAKTAHINYRGRSTLLDPETNIKLGTHYLGQIYSRFGDNQVLATAAYNAGPHRVKTWLPKETWQADIWVENIPFTETRRYVKRVLAAQAVTHWRLTGTEQRLASMMPPILSNPGTANKFASK